MAKPITFWFEFASTYSYLSAMRIDAAAAAQGVLVEWKPFLLGPIFKKQGWDTSPFSIYPEKGRNMWRDMERRAEKYGVPFNRPRPDQFPQNSVLAARTALIALQAPWGRDYCREIYRAQFVRGLEISQPDIVRDCVLSVGGDESVIEKANLPETKRALRTQTDEAISLGIYGAPSFVVDDELFWGDDRLEDALDWAQRA